jgi:hypothetical protein
MDEWLYLKIGIHLTTKQRYAVIKIVGTNCPKANAQYPNALHAKPKVVKDMSREPHRSIRERVLKFISLLRTADGTTLKDVITNTRLMTLMTFLHSGDWKKSAIYPEEPTNNKARMNEKVRLNMNIEFRVLFSPILFWIIASANPKLVNKFAYPISIIAIPIIPKSFGTNILATMMDITKDTICVGILSRVFQYSCDLVLIFSLVSFSISFTIFWRRRLVRDNTKVGNDLTTHQLFYLPLYRPKEGEWNPFEIYLTAPVRKNR